MKLFLNYLVKYSLQAALITQIFWFVAFVVIVYFKGTVIAWHYAMEFYPSASFLILSTLPCVIITLPIAALDAWRDRSPFTITE
jgi:hypothetical protein